MKKLRPVFIAFFAGLLAGILWTNYDNSSAVRVNGLSQLSLLEKYLEEPASGRKYLLYLLGQRGTIYIMGGLFGISIFGVPMSLMFMSIMGFSIGAVLSAALLDGGVWGFILGIGLLMPHYLVYVPASIAFFGYSYSMSYGYWKNRKYGKKEYQGYTLAIFLSGITVFVGILLECYVNPVVLRFLMDKINFF